MYVPKAFEETRSEVLQSFVRERGFGSLVVRCRVGLEVVPMPFLVAENSGAHAVLSGHVARVNSVWRAAEPDEAVAIFSGPDAYVSPSWYPSKVASGGRAVPTWNYVAVHAHGSLRFIEDKEWLRAHLGALLDRHEGQRDKPWRLSDAPDDYIAQMLGAIVGVELTVARWYGKWKLGQNRSAEDQLGIVQGLRADGSPGAFELSYLLGAISRPS